MFICIEKSPFLSPVQGEGGVKKKRKKKNEGEKGKTFAQTPRGGTI